MHIDSPFDAGIVISFQDKALNIKFFCKKNESYRRRHTEKISHFKRTEEEKIIHFLIKDIKNLSRNISFKKSFMI